MSHNRIPIVCLVLLALTASGFVATQLNSGQAPKKDNSPLEMKVLRDKAHVKRLEVKFEFLNFGDGTGYVGNEATALPRAIPEDESSTACRPLIHADIFGWNEAPPGSQLSKIVAYNLQSATWLWLSHAANVSA